MKVATKKLTEQSGVSIYERAGKFRVVLGKKVTGTEKIDKQFHSEDKAVEFVESWVKDRAELSDVVKQLNDIHIIDAFAALTLRNDHNKKYHTKEDGKLDELNQCKVTLQEVMKLYLDSLPVSKQIGLDELCELYIDDRDTSGWAAKRHLKQLEYSFKPLRAYFSGKYVHTIIGSDLVLFMRQVHGYKAPKTFNNHRLNLCALFAFAHMQGYINKDESRLVKVRKVESQEVGVLTPVEVKSLLEYAKEHHSSVLVALALQAFAGLRRSEVMRMTWGDIRGGYVVVTAENAKTSSRRTIPILPPLKELLKDYKGMDPDTKVYSNTVRMLHEWRVKCSDAVKIDWKHNCLRHSFVTYRLMQTNDENSTAMEAGHSVKILNKHYKALLDSPKEDAESYWTLFN